MRACPCGACFPSPWRLTPGAGAPGCTSTRPGSTACWWGVYAATGWFGMCAICGPTPAATRWLPRCCSGCVTMRSSGAPAACSWSCRARRHTSRSPSAPASGRTPRRRCSGARPRARGDEHALFQLYTAAVPAPARAAEALTLEEWAALHKGARRWSPRQLSGRRQFVWDTGAGLAGWLELVESGRSQHLEWLVHPQHERHLDALVAGGLSCAQPRLPLYATCRAYQAGVRAALERAGFALVAECIVLVCQLAVRVPARPLVAAVVRSTIGG